MLSIFIPLDPCSTLPLFALCCGSWLYQWVSLTSGAWLNLIENNGKKLEGGRRAKLGYLTPSFPVCMVAGDCLYPSHRRPWLLTVGFLVHTFIKCPLLNSPLIILIIVCHLFPAGTLMNTIMLRLNCLQRIKSLL